jgi:hypothetical protein
MKRIRRLAQAGNGVLLATAPTDKTLREDDKLKWVREKERREDGRGSTIGASSE